LEQARKALDAGAFHNDVVGVANESVLFLHEQSFEDRNAAYAQIRNAAPFVQIIEAPTKDVSLEDAVTSYLFNSQLVTLPGGEMALILPGEAEANARTRAFLERVVEADNPVRRLVFKDVRESMRNGGGPACLRLRVLLSDDERRAVNQKFILDYDKLEKLEGWVRDHYRDRLHPDDLRDPGFMNEARSAIEALYTMLGLSLQD
ncbi:MAG: N-succinylarginine dihydrolase, partial [Pseudomonadota bacterium]